LNKELREGICSESSLQVGVGGDDTAEDKDRQSGLTADLAATLRTIGRAEEANILVDL